MKFTLWIILVTVLILPGVFYIDSNEVVPDSPLGCFPKESFILPVEGAAKEDQVLVWVDPTEKIANRYFNLALSCMMLLDLELKIEDRRETWGVMADICRSRHNISKED